jgi:hypothetical protein
MWLWYYCECGRVWKQPRPIIRLSFFNPKDRCKDCGEWVQGYYED